ncbi:MAG: glycoside hydrolase family 127 protein [Kiritimatiellia bacterium]|nr:glycoside hydrolase family 127 protein [Kiritimatiellia bacterium]
MNHRTEVEAPLKSVRITDGFWAELVERNCTATLPHALQRCKEEGDIENIKIAAGHSGGDYSGGADRDSDLFKVMEGAAYCLAIKPDEALDARLDELISLIAAAQEADGYLQSYFTSQAPDKRYADMSRCHELYCFGHLIEAAVAHFEATGKRSFLDVALRVADHADETFGPGKFETTSGHQGIELALMKLYRVTGERRHFELGKYFVDVRGDTERVKREYSGKPILEGDRRPGRNRPPAYRQDHLPVLEQREATGHAVRAGYLYTAIADIAMESDLHDYAVTAEAIWENIVSKKLYISGGAGTHQYDDEGFGDEYLLPNDGYCETCGGVAMMLFSQRMGLLTGDAKYADVVETILYNHFLSSTDLSGCLTFYRNPLSCSGPRERLPWNYPACCPTNVVRIIPQVPALLYATTGNDLYVDHFAGSAANIHLGTGGVQVTQETEYPWKGRVTITVEPETAFDFAMHVRIPGWVDGRPVPSDLYSTRGGSATPTIKVNDEAIDTTARVKGYCVINRTWQTGDQITIDFPMQVQRVYAHPKVEANQGRVALMRGPLLYCLEETDLGTDPEEVALPPEAELHAKHLPDLLGGVTALTDSAGTLQAVPFSHWNNREPGRMLVWVKENK